MWNIIFYFHSMAWRGSHTCSKVFTESSFCSCIFLHISSKWWIRYAKRWVSRHTLLTPLCIYQQSFRLFSKHISQLSASVTPQHKLIRIPDVSKLIHDHRKKFITLVWNLQQSFPPSYNYSSCSFLCMYFN